MAINGGKVKIFLSNFRKFVCFWANQNPVKTPNVLQTTKVPANDKIIPMAKPSWPYNISNMGKPANEMLPIPEVIIRTALVFLGIGFATLTASKKSMDPR